VLRADELEGYAENSQEAREPTMIAEGAWSLRVQAPARWQGARREGVGPWHGTAIPEERIGFAAFEFAQQYG